jgi:D-sedoheptulose 7-phosphate isomerase
MGHAEQSAALAERIAAHFADSAQLKVAAAQALAGPIARAVEAMAGSLRGGGKVLACGNGGSAAAAQHFAAELVNRFERERPPLAALSLAADSSNLTSINRRTDYWNCLKRRWKKAWRYA